MGDLCAKPREHRICRCITRIAIGYLTRANKRHCAHLCLRREVARVAPAQSDVACCDVTRLCIATRNAEEQAVGLKIATETQRPITPIVLSELRLTCNPEFPRLQRAKACARDVIDQARNEGICGPEGCGIRHHQRLIGIQCRIHLKVDHLRIVGKTDGPKAGCHHAKRIRARAKIHVANNCATVDFQRVVALPQTYCCAAAPDNRAGVDHRLGARIGGIGIDPDGAFDPACIGDGRGLC